MVKGIGNGSKKYSKTDINDIVGNIWYNQLSNKKRLEIYRRHGKKKSPNV